MAAEEGARFAANSIQGSITISPGIPALSSSAPAASIVSAARLKAVSLSLSTFPTWPAPLTSGSIK